MGHDSFCYTLDIHLVDSVVEEDATWDGTGSATPPKLSVQSLSVGDRETAEGMALSAALLHG